MSAEFFCSACRTPFQNGFALGPDGICATCREGSQEFDFAYSYGFYEGPLRDLIHLYKYAGMQALRRRFLPLLSAALPRETGFDAVVPVPLHWRRYWSRGFNQAAQLAQDVAALRGIRFARALKRVKWNGAQAGLALYDRRENISGAFRVKGSVQGLRILLVDDVMTTGATAGVCAKVLKRAGAESVTLLTLARVDRRLAASSARTSQTGAS
jgi:ComF family protein